MKNIPIIFLITLLVACSNPEAKAKENNSMIENSQQNNSKCLSRIPMSSAKTYTPYSCDEGSITYVKMREVISKEIIRVEILKDWTNSITVNKDGKAYNPKSLVLNSLINCQTKQEKIIDSSWYKENLGQGEKFFSSSRDWNDVKLDDRFSSDRFRVACPNTPFTQKPSGKDPKKVADEIQIAGVSRCIAAVTVMSAGLVSNPNIKSDGPEIKNNNSLMQFYGAARTYLLQSMNNPGAVGAMDNMVRQHADYFGNIIKFQGWGNFMPEYKQCQNNAN